MIGERDIEAIANRVVELLEDRNPPRALVDAAEVARLLGVSRATVYERAAELGAVRIGAGPKARLRFDPSQLLGVGSQSSVRASGGGPPRRRRRVRSTGEQRLLPIRARVSQ